MNDTAPCCEASVASKLRSPIDSDAKRPCNGSRVPNAIPPMIANAHMVVSDGSNKKASVDIKVIRYTPVSARLAPNLFSIKARAARPGSDKNPRAPDIATAVERLKPSV